MTAHELMEWRAYEETFGSLIVHERIDAGFAQVSMLLAQAFSKPGKEWRQRDFMPKWFQDLTAEADLMRGIEQLKRLAGGDGANHLDAHR